LNEALTAGTQGTAQCARCGAVFTYHHEAESKEKQSDNGKSQKPEKHEDP
jgi:hypothetical protein